MKYAEVQQSLEEFVQATWSDTQIHFDNVAFNSDMYTEFVRCNVLFGEGIQRSVTKGCYRQIGSLVLSVFTKSASGSARKLELANIASLIVTSAVVRPVAPLIAPSVNLMVPTLFNENNERNGWVMAQVSCPFYYDLEI